VPVPILQHAPGAGGTGARGPGAGREITDSTSRVVRLAERRGGRIRLYRPDLIADNVFRAVSARKSERPNFFCASVEMAKMVMSDIIPVTRAGYEKLRAELEELQSVQMPAIAKRIAEARSEGDLSENAEYHGARESQGMLQAKINLLSDKLARAAIVDTSKLPRDEVVFGATVVVKDLDFGDQETFTMVGAGEEDYENGRIMVTSPLAQGLLGRKVGEKVDIAVPAGTVRFEILEIRHEE
jgi:transcription elongation factor GreA